MIEHSTDKKKLFDGNWFTRFFFIHLNKVCDLGGSRPYQMGDLFEVNDNFKTIAYENRRKYFADGAVNKKRSFLNVLIGSCKRYFLVGGTCFFFSSFIQIITPIFLLYFLDWIQRKEYKVWEGYVYATILFVVGITKSMLAQHAMHTLHQGACVISNYVGAMISEKVSNLPPGARKYLSIGQITNFLTTDIKGIQGSVMMIHQLLVTPLILLVYIGMIIAVTKWAGLIVLGIIIVCVPVQLKLNQLAVVQSRKRLILADKRSKLITQIINGVKNIKFNAWEQIMIDQLDDIRKQEKGLVVLNFLISGLAGSVSKLIPPLCTVAVIWSYNKIYNPPLSIGETFYIITLFNLFLQPINVLMFALISFASATASSTRLRQVCAILDYEEQNNAPDLAKGAIQFDNASFGWLDPFYQQIFEPKKAEEQGNYQATASRILKGINIKITPGSFNVVVGKVGSGKSSFLLACMNEMLIMEGTSGKNGTVAYIPQEGFLLNDTVKNNILFGNNFDLVRYQKAIDLSQLAQDLRELPGGEQTEIGERGINLSGGQKQRIMIARAVFAEREINLIDDSLSALDAYVGKKVYDGVFCGSMKNTTRVMVTHHLHILEDKKIDNIIFISQGEIICFGKYDEIKNNKEFNNYCSEIEKEDDEEKPDDPMNKEAGNKIDGKAVKVEMTKKLSRAMSGMDEPELGPKKSSIKVEAWKVVQPVEGEKNAAETDKLKKGKLTKAELKFEGQVPMSVYWRYLTSGSTLAGIGAILFYIISAFLLMVANFWAGVWAERKDGYGPSNDNEYGYVYLVIVGLIFISIMMRSWLFGIFASKSGYTLFNKLINNVLRRPMSFFDTTPNGVIMNRCNDDVYQSDFILPNTFSFFLESLTLILVSLIAIVVILPYLLILLVIFSVFLFYAFRKYMRTAVELRRITQVAVSPMLSRVSESISGIISIRAYEKLGWIREKFNIALEQYTSSQVHERLAAVWVNFRLEMMVGILGGLAPFMIALIKTQGWKLASAEGNNAIYGTILTNVYLLANILIFFIFGFSEMAKGMSSIQRLIEYIDYTEHERAWEQPRAPQNWPSHGQIEFKNLSVRYREKLPLVINSLDFLINENQKVGIVGRTGSGKSTILLALMRVLEMDEDENKTPVGSIEIDGIKIDSIGLHELRKKVVVIPQDPFLLQGTLRFNIDPLYSFSDELILESLNTVQILDSIRTEDIIEQKIKAYKAQKALESKSKMGGRPGGPGAKPVEAASPTRKPNELDSPASLITDRAAVPEEDPEITKLRNTIITEKEKLEFAIESEGANLSIGQRQLICIARSLIRKPKILLMDEATANIDQKTDAIIQRVIKHNMNNTTVITIAHRLITIVQYDKILILENGTKKEEGSPLELINSHGYFYKLVSEGGAEFEEKMTKLAKDKNLDPNSI